MPISPESHYCLTGHLEFFNITHDVYDGVMYAKMDLDRMFDDMEVMPENGMIPVDSENSWRQSLVYRASKIYDAFKDWYHNADNFQRAHVGLVAFTASDFQLGELVSNATTNLIDEYMSVNKIKSTGWIPIPEPRPCSNLPARQITSEFDLEQNIDRIFEYDFFLNWKPLFEEQWERIHASLNAIDIRDLVSYERNFVARERQRILDLANVRLTDNGPVLGSIYAIYVEPFKEKIPEKSAVRDARKSIKKAIKLFTRLFGENKIKAFLRGHELIVNGKNYDYRITKNQSVVKHTLNPTGGHIPYKLELIAKDNVVLSSMCIYVENTPVIDQLIALCLYVQNDEDENDYLRKANFFDKKPEFWNNEHLRALTKEKYRAPLDSNYGCGGPIIDLGEIADQMELNIIESRICEQEATRL